MPSLDIPERLLLLGARACPRCQNGRRDYCRSCDEFYFWCCQRARHVGHRVYMTRDGEIDVTPFALATRGTP